MESQTVTTADQNPPHKRRSRFDITRDLCGYLDYINAPGDYATMKRLYMPGDVRV